jgi:hypothetical protein
LYSYSRTGALLLPAPLTQEAGRTITTGGSPFFAGGGDLIKHLSGHANHGNK